MPHGSATVRDPVCGMTVDPATSQASLRPSRRRPSISARPAAGPNSPPTRSLSRQRQAEGRSAGRRHLHLPDASADPPGRPRQLPDLRHGAGARGGEPRYAAQSRARRHDTAVLDRRRAGAAGGGAGNGRSPGRRSRLGRPDAVELDSTGLRHARRDLGGLAVLRARLAIAADAQSQHVHPDRDGHRRRLCLQRHRHRRARQSSRPAFRGHGGAVAVYFEAAAVITVLVLLGQVLELRAREATSGAIKALLQLAPKTARRIGEDGADHEVRDRQPAGRRSSAGSSGREGAGGRRDSRRPLLARRIAGNRRIDAGYQGNRGHR